MCRNFAGLDLSHWVGTMMAMTTQMPIPMIYSFALSFDHLAKLLEIAPEEFDDNPVVTFFESETEAISAFLAGVYGPPMREWSDTKLLNMVGLVRKAILEEGCIMGGNFIAPDVHIVLSALPLVAK